MADSFTDIAKESGLTFSYPSGMESQTLSLLETIGGGGGVLDFDLDGRLDIVIAGGGRIIKNIAPEGFNCAVFQQFADATFRQVSDSSNVDTSEFYSHGICAGDFNNDGFSDFCVTGYGGLLLFKNQGDGTFIRCANDRLASGQQWTTSAAWGDLTGDGNLDLYAACYADWSWDNHPTCYSTQNRHDVCPPRVFQGIDDRLYWSDGQGHFKLQSTNVGLSPAGKGLGVVMADFDDDLDLDIYVANDTDRNFLYLNDGHAHFHDGALLAGVATDHLGKANGSMGVATFDFNLDQRLDLWVSNFENESSALYRNDGHGEFTCCSQTAGLLSFGTGFVGFGTVADDFDADGDEDVVVACGHILHHPDSGLVAQHPLLLLNHAGRFVRDTAKSGYFASRHHGRGLVRADIDNDGDPDLCFIAADEPVGLLRNDSTRKAKWLGMRLIGTVSNRDAIGAKVQLDIEGQKVLKYIAGGSSYLSTNDLRICVAVPSATQTVTATVTWPNGGRQEMELHKFNRYENIVQREESSAQ